MDLKNPSFHFVSSFILFNSRLRGTYNFIIYFVIVKEDGIIKVKENLNRVKEIYIIL